MIVDAAVTEGEGFGPGGLRRTTSLKVFENFFYLHNPRAPRFCRLWVVHAARSFKSRFNEKGVGSPPKLTVQG